MAVVKNMLDLIGRTPLVQIQGLSEKYGCQLLGKLESSNPTGSVKDRAALAMVEAAEQQGVLQPGGTIIEPTSGNTGIALAFIGAVKHYSVILVMPDSMSVERRSLLRAYGATLELTPGHLGMTGAIERAHELRETYPNAFIPQQFNNPENPAMHRRSTAEEIWQDTNGEVAVFVSGVGTGGTITGVGEVLKKRKPSVSVIGVEPKDSAVLSGKPAGPHMIQGIGAGFIPDNLNAAVMDAVIQVSNEQALAMARYLACKEGLLVGISAGANIHAAVQMAKKPENKGRCIVSVLCDTGERYLSTVLFQ